MTLWRTLFGFDGRIGRSVFWLSAFAVLLIDLSVAAVVSDWIHTEYLSAGAPHRPGGAFVGAGFGLLAVVAISIWIGLALKIKRAHDIDRSGWWLAIGLIPIYGAVRLIIDLGFRKGSARRNRFGDPLGFVDNSPLPSTLELDPEPLAPLAASSAEEPPPPAESASSESIPPEAGAPELIDGGGSADALAGIAHEAAAAKDPADSAEPAAAATEEQASVGDEAPKPIHPLMLWGANYRADLHWPEFGAAPVQEASPKPEEAQPEAETPLESRSEPAPEPVASAEAAHEEPPAAESAPAEHPPAQPEATQIEPVEPVEALAEAVEPAEPIAPDAPAPPHAAPPVLELAHPEPVPLEAPLQGSPAEPRPVIKLSEAAWAPASLRDSFADLDPVAPKPANDPFKL
jgi:uncharacterized membrane protein YhaH (DUF805 family)